MSAISTALGSLVMPVKAWSPAKESPHATFVYVDLSSIDRETKEIVAPQDMTGTDAPSRARQLLKAGDVLVSTVRPNLNAVAVVSDDLDGATGSTGFCVLRADPQRLDNRYLYHWVRSPAFIASMVRRATGASYPAVSDRVVKQSKVPLPPLPEQRRIAAILDKADAVRRKRQQTLDLADQFLRSTFLGMFGDPVTNPKGWPVKKLSEAFVTDIVPTKCGPFGSALRKDEYTDSGVPVLTMNNIAGDSFCLDGCLHITQEKYQDLSTYAVREGDIIISRAGTVGKMCVVPPLDAPAIISTNLIRLSLDGRILEPAFFVALMTYCRGRVGKLRTGNDGSYTFMNTGILRRLPVPFPSPTVQTDWVRLLSWMSQHVSRLMGHQGVLHDLSDSLIQRAFRGELT